MKRLELVEVNHNIKAGQQPVYHEPNVTESCLFVENGKVIGFYLKELPPRIENLLNIANREFNSKRVPKSKMTRAGGVAQFSTIIGGVPPRTHNRRPYPSVSSVHSHDSAKNFIKAMMLLAKHTEELIELWMPEEYAAQKAQVKQVPHKFTLSELYTSSISNYNISAKYHTDRSNIEGSLNAIYTKRKMADGGCLHVPEYGATIEQADGSLLIYPAWRNMHGVTPILPRHEKGYRNSLVFYALKAFQKYNEND